MKKYPQNKWPASEAEWRLLSEEVFRYAFCYKHDYVWAEDVTSKVLLITVKQLSSPEKAKTIKSPMGWIFGMAYKIFRKHRSKELPIEQEYLDSQTYEDPISLKTDDIDDNKSRVAVAMDKLSTRERQIITALFWRKQKVRQVAAELNLQGPQVSRIRYRALKKMAKVLNVSSGPRTGSTGPERH